MRGGDRCEKEREGESRREKTVEGGRDEENRREKGIVEDRDGLGLRRQIHLRVHNRERTHF